MVNSAWIGGAQVERQLENEKAALLERKRREQAEQKRKQADLERILEENRRKVLLGLGSNPDCSCMQIMPKPRQGTLDCS